MKKANEKTFAQQFKEVLKSLCHTRSYSQVWADFIRMSACSISNATDKAMFEQREEMYLQASGHYTRDELVKIAHLFALTALALEENPEQDFLGELYTNMNLCNIRKGQIFTPYPVAKLMALSSCGCFAELIKEKGYASVNDPCCGAGVMLIAAANVAREQGVNYQRDMVFVGQDIDFTVAMMAYVQLSLLGCIGHIAVGNSLHPEQPSRENIWFLPMNVHRRKLLEEFYYSN